MSRSYVKIIEVRSPFVKFHQFVLLKINNVICLLWNDNYYIQTIVILLEYFYRILNYLFIHIFRSNQPFFHDDSIERESYKKKEKSITYVRRNNVAIREHDRVANCTSIWQLYNSCELDPLTETRRLSIYDNTRMYVCHKQIQGYPHTLMVACTYVMQTESIKYESSIKHTWKTA